MKINTKHERHIWLFLIVVLFTALVSSCTKKDIQFGSQFIDDQYTQLIQLDSMHPAFSTLLIDSFTTSASGTGLIGQLADPAFGTLNMEAYFQLGAPDIDATAGTFDHAIFDSICLYVPLDSGKYYGDTTRAFTLAAYQLKEKITAPDNGSVLYNTNAFAASTEALGKSTQLLYPNRNNGQDSINIRLSNELGSSLLSMLQSNNSNIQSNDLFVSFFKGLKLVSEQQNTLAIGCKDSIIMRLYYKTPGLPQAEQHVADFSLYNQSLQFNHIAISRSGPLAQAGIGPTNKEIASGLTDSLSFLQPLCGNFIKIGFPNLSTLLQQQNFLQIVNATLYIRPDKEFTSGYFTLPPALALAETDLNNTIGTALTDASTGETQTGQLYIDYTDNTGLATYYSYDLTSYLRTLITDNTATSLKKGLLLIPASDQLYNSFQRLVAMDAYNSQSKAVLKIQFLSLK